MNSFSALETLWDNPDFAESAVFGDSAAVPVIASQITLAEALGEYGIEENIDYSLDVRLSDMAAPERSTKVTFRNKQYKVVRAIVDSANISFKAFIVAEKKRV